MKFLSSRNSNNSSKAASKAATSSFGADFFTNEIISDTVLAVSVVLCNMYFFIIMFIELISGIIINHNSLKSKTNNCLSVC